MRMAAQGKWLGRNRALLAGAGLTVVGLCEGQANSQADPTFLLLWAIYITSASLAEADRELEVNGSTDTIYSGQSPGFEQENKGGGRTPFPAWFPNWTLYSALKNYALWEGHLIACCFQGFTAMLQGERTHRSQYYLRRHLLTDQQCLSRLMSIFHTAQRQQRSI